MWAGANGQVYDLLDTTDKVAKLSILFDKFEDNKTVDTEFDIIKNTYQFIIDNPNSSLAKVYDFKQLYKGSQSIWEWEHQYIIYYSIMEKLLPMRRYKTKIFQTICDIYNEKIENKERNKYNT